MKKTSISVQDLRKRIGDKAKAEPHHRFWGIYTHVWKLNVLVLTIVRTRVYPVKNAGEPQKPSPGGRAAVQVRKWARGRGCG